MSVKRPRDGWDRDERDVLDAIGPALNDLQTRHAGDPPIELLRAARADVLPGELGSDASRLLETSRWNRALVEGADDADASLTDEEQSRLLRRIHTEHRRTANRAWTWRWQPAFATAALVAFVTGTTWILWRQSPESPSAPTPDAQIAVANPPPAPSYLLPLDKPQIKVSAAKR